MLATSTRLLRLLSLFQARRDWPGAALADRLGVSARTVRRDVDRLRALGYPVQATMGTGGGYRLGAGAALPPLLLDDEEAVTLAVVLREAAGGAVSGREETALRALAKLEQVLPDRLRRRVDAVQAYTVPVPLPGPAVEPELLAVIAGACRDRERLRFDYRDHDGAPSRRAVEPHRLVSWGRRWYLVGWDTGRGDWRTFRADRIALRLPIGPRFAPRDPPADDLAAYVARGVSAAGWALRARVTLHAPAETVAERLWPGYGVLEAVDERTSVLDVGADTTHVLAALLGVLDVEFDVHEPPELVERLRTLAGRYGRAGRRSTGHSPHPRRTPPRRRGRTEPPAPQWGLREAE
ncbi:MAG TPA: YafY family protein [Chloroflexota bacterium]|nr:YafY family protein [Chloroflexota bacterium]